MAASAASQLEAWRHYGIGMGAAAGDVLLSGFASIYFERVLKSVDETYSVRSGRDRWMRERHRERFSTCSTYPPTHTQPQLSHHHLPRTTRPATVAPRYLELASFLLPQV